MILIHNAWTLILIVGRVIPTQHFFSSSSSSSSHSFSYVLRKSISDFYSLALFTTRTYCARTFNLHNGIEMLKRAIDEFHGK
jgi:hypothetical protein